ncbi:MAG: peptidase M16 [Candidatus Cloacimonetes bacterium HGW-Cloacimonetes-3]|jgi:zinc protease|nr:MAG: peptidase M16 [Candidatus Cloacimonetes bacterium HGW-Cloacimonetes-3]
MKGKWLSIIILLCAITLGAIIPPEYAPMPLPTDPDLITGKLANGLTYYILPNAKPEKRVELRLLVNAGSVQEDEDQLGLAHFVEHMAFNGSKNFARTQMVEYLTSIGMGFHNGLNGGTSYDFTVYQFKLPTDNEATLRKGISILSDIAWQLSFDPSEIERERGIIQEEWRMGQEAQRRVQDKVNNVRYAGSRYALRNPIGTIENLKTFKHDSLKRYYNDWYRPDLQHVIIIGDYPPEALKAMVEEYFGVIPARENPRKKEKYSVPDNAEPRAVVVLDKELPYSVVQATWKKPAVPVVDLGTYYDELKRDIFYTMFNNRMQEISMQPDPPFSYAYGLSMSMLEGFNSSTLMAVSTEGRSEDAMHTMLTEAVRIRQHGFKPGEFERAKLELIRAAETAVSEKATRESDEATWELLMPIMSGDNIISAEQKFDMVSSIIHEIGLDEVNDIVDDLISTDNLTLSVTGTAKEGAVYPNEQRLLAMYSEIKNTDLEDYEDTTVDEPIIENIPIPGRITKSTTFPKSGIKKWVLSNGVTVYSKQTDFKADEVLLSSQSPGGTALLNSDDARISEIISHYSHNSGFGNFDGPALQKAMAGKVADAYPKMDIYSEGFSGTCSPKDLELMFQMLYQKATVPRFNQATFSSSVAQIRSFLQNSLLSPENAFFDTLETLIYDNHPYKRGMRPADLDKITLQQLERVYRDRFGDFSDFTFYVVGAFDEEQLRTYCTTYLANLPTMKRKDKIRNIGIKPFSGKKEIRFHKGESDLTFATNVTKGKYKYTAANNIAMNTLMMVAFEKLRENVREDLSGVYAIQNWSTMERYPKPFYTVQTWMSCDPAKVDMLNDATFATLDSLKQGLFEAKYVESAKTTMLKRYEESIKSNRYWIASMERNLWVGQPIDIFVDYPAIYAKMDKKTVTKAAKKYLSFDKDLLKVIMLPEVPQE